MKKKVLLHEDKKKKMLMKENKKDKLLMKKKVLMNIHLG